MAMGLSVESERHNLSQNDTINDLLRRIPLTELVSVYEEQNSAGGCHTIYCALIPSTRIFDALTSSDWDLGFGSGTPGSLETFGRSPERGIPQVRERRRDRAIGDCPGVQGIKEDYLEISEEFRLFHNLFHDRQRDEYFKIDDSGNMDLVAVAQPNQVKVRMKEIRQFLAVKEMHLSLQFDCVVYSNKTMDELGLTPGGEVFNDGSACWNLNHGRAVSGLGGKRTFSRLLGKRLVPPLSKSKSGFFGFATEPQKQYLDFIIGVDDDGNEIMHTCDPESLANSFGRNPDAAHELTPVTFRKQFLTNTIKSPANIKSWMGTFGVVHCGA